MRRDEGGHGVKNIFTKSASQLIRSSSEVQVRNYMFPCVNASFMKSQLELAGRDRCYGVMVLWVETGEQWQQDSHMIRQLILKKATPDSSTDDVDAIVTDYFAVHYPFTFHIFPIKYLIISLLLI